MCCCCSLQINVENFRSTILAFFLLLFVFVVSNNVAAHVSLQSRKKIIKSLISLLETWNLIKIATENVGDASGFSKVSTSGNSARACFCDEKKQSGK